MSEIQQKINKMSNEQLEYRLTALKTETKKERKDILELQRKITVIKESIAPQLDEMSRIEQQIKYNIRIAESVKKRKETIAKNKAMKAKVIPAESPPSREDRKMIFLSGL